MGGARVPHQQRAAAVPLQQSVLARVPCHVSRARSSLARVLARLPARAQHVRVAAAELLGVGVAVVVGVGELLHAVLVTQDGETRQLLQGVRAAPSLLRGAPPWDRIVMRM